MALRVPLSRTYMNRLLPGSGTWFWKMKDVILEKCPVLLLYGLWAIDTLTSVVKLLLGPCLFHWGLLWPGHLIIHERGSAAL